MARSDSYFTLIFQVMRLSKIYLCVAQHVHFYYVREWKFIAHTTSIIIMKVEWEIGVVFLSKDKLRDKQFQFNELRQCIFSHNAAHSQQVIPCCNRVIRKNVNQVQIAYQQPSLTVTCCKCKHLFLIQGRFNINWSSVCEMWKKKFFQMKSHALPHT